MLFSITNRSTLLYYDKDAKAIRHGAPSHSPRNLCFTELGGQQVLMVRSSDSLFLPLTGDLSNQDQVFLQVREVNNRNILALAPDEKCRLYDDMWEEIYTQIDGPAEFLLVTEYELNKIIALLDGDWFLPGVSQILRHRDLQIRNDFSIKMGPLEINWFDLLSAFPTESLIHSDLEVTVIHSGWRITRLFRYKPLIYMCAFGADAIFEYLKIFLTSIELFGNYDGEILILSDRSSELLEKYIPQSIRQRVKTAYRFPKNAREMGSSRYTLTSTELELFQPILYSDVDVVCNNDLTPMLTAVLNQSQICYVPEFPGISVNQIQDEVQPWFGSFLFANDIECKTIKPACLNSGVLGFRNFSIIDDVFPAIRASHLRFEFKSATRFQDQPFASYVIQKLGLGNGTTLPHFVSLIVKDANFDFSQKGLAHFIGGFGHTGKIIQMDSYLAYLQSLID